MVWMTRSTVSVLAAAAALCAALPGAAPGGPAPKANSTLFGPNVFVFDPAGRLVASPGVAFSSEVRSGSREENASKDKST